MTDLNPIYAICKSCDLVVLLPKFKPGFKCKCPNCNTTLRRGRYFSLATIANCALAAVIFLVLTIFEPFISISTLGISSNFSLIDICFILYNRWNLLLVLLLLFSFISPLVVLLMQFAVGLLHYHPGRIAANIYTFCHRFCFADVFLLGVLVSLIKITSLSNVDLHQGFVLIFCYSFLCVWCLLHLKPHDFWNLVQNKTKLNIKSGIKAKTQGVIYCRHCGNSYLRSEHTKCPRCFKNNDYRLHQSLQKTLALVIAASILYLPSNIYPIMFTNYLGSNLGSNIIDGVITLWKLDSYFVAIVILVASLFIPVFKLFSIILLLFMVKFAKNYDKRHLSNLFRFVEFIGKWSMIDVFVVIFMTSSVRFTGLMEISPGIAIIIFAFVVLITMFAADEFDERLIWDKK